MKKLFSTLLILFAIGISSCSHEDNNTETTVDYTISLQLPLNISGDSLTETTATLTNVASGKSYQTTSFSLSGDYYISQLTLPEGTYTISVSGKVRYSLDSTEVYSTVKATKENTTISTSQKETVLALSTFSAKEGFVISEIFYTGTLTPEGDTYADDQYIKIANNSSDTLYADGLTFVESAFATDDKQDYTPNIMEQAITAEVLYAIPGGGTQYPVAPGEEILIAITAINHKELNTNSMDLSSADFEIYDESSDPDAADVDNPNVPNLISWYVTDGNYVMHTRGVKAYALATPEVDRSTFLAKYLYTYTYQFTYGEYTMPMDANGYKLPNTWVADAINLAVYDDHQWNVVSATLDAGWTYCGSVSNDEARYGKAVVRKKANGKWTDTNNSSDDFTPNASPSMLK